MSILAEWNGHNFEVSSQVLMSFRDMVIKGGSTTKDTTSKNQSYVTRKNGNAVEVTLTAMLNRHLGVSVQEEAMAFVKEATEGKTAYLYCGNEKLVTCQMMLTSAQVEKIEMTQNGTWTSCEVGLTLKQCSKFDETTSSGVSGTSTRKAAATQPVDKNNHSITGIVIAGTAGGTTGTTATGSTGSVTEQAKQEISRISRIVGAAQKSTEINKRKVLESKGVVPKNKITTKD